MDDSVFFSIIIGIGNRDDLDLMSGVNYFFSLTTIISPYQRQLLFDS